MAMVRLIQLLLWWFALGRELCHGVAREFGEGRNAREVAKHRHFAHDCPYTCVQTREHTRYNHTDLHPTSLTLLPKISSTILDTTRSRAAQFTSYTVIQRS
jgi:hypothetical protein